jgi:hypothetical protein
MQRKDDRWGKGWFLANAIGSATTWVGNTLTGAGGSGGGTAGSNERQPKPIWGFFEKWFDDIEVKHDKDELRSYCREQLSALRNNIMHSFALFVENNNALLYELDFFKG